MHLQCCRNFYISNEPVQPNPARPALRTSPQCNLPNRCADAQHGPAAIDRTFHPHRPRTELSTLPGHVQVGKVRQDTAPARHVRLRVHIRAAVQANADVARRRVQGRIGERMVTHKLHNDRTGSRLHLRAAAQAEQLNASTARCHLHRTRSACQPDAPALGHRLYRAFNVSQVQDSRRRWSPSNRQCTSAPGYCPRPSGSSTRVSCRYKRARLLD